jgi:methyltransferase (TIGR00027 family)
VADGASLFADPLANRILGPDLRAQWAVDPVWRPLRLFVALRSRLSEDNARNAIANGVRQVVVLGAGLDTFACRAPATPDLRVFEIDHADTQAEKRRRLAAAGVAAPAHLVFAPCDFEHGRLAESLASAGFEGAEPAAFVCLGVTPYLTPQTVEDTLHFVAHSPAKTSIVLDYANPIDSIDSPGHRLFHERMAAHVAELGETFRSAFETSALHDLLRGLGADEIDDYGPRRISAMLTPDAPSPPENGGHILRASFPAR